MKAPDQRHEGGADRVLIVAASSGDGEALQQTLGSAGVEADTFRDVEALCASLEGGCSAGCVVVAEESLGRSALLRLGRTLAGEPSWSELPVVVMTCQGGSTERISGIVRELGGVARVTFLERSVSILTLTSAVRAAQQSRSHQYRVRDTIEKLSRAERSLKESDARLRAAVEGSGIGVFEYDVIENRLMASEQCWQIVAGESSPAERTLERWNEVVHPEDRGETEKAWARACDPNGDGTYEVDYRVVRDDGSTRWVTARGTMKYGEGEVHSRPVRLVGTVQDVTRDRAAEERLRILTSELELRVAARTEKLRQRTNQLRKLANQLVTAEQRERERLAQMLHDHLQQILAAAKIQLDLVEGRFEDEELNERLNDVQELLEEAVTASRSLSIELSPPGLRNGSLEGALRWQAQWMESHHRLRTDIFVEKALPRIAPESKVLLYEAVRELLFNVVKHAEVPACALRLFSKEGKLCLSVEDKGRGFDRKALEEKGVEGFGLFSTRERVEAIGGKMEIESACGKGSTFRLYVPTIEAAFSVDGQRMSPLETTKRADAARRKVRLLVVDDHPIVRDGLVSMLRKRSDMKVVGEAADGEEAIDLAALLRPDVIVMDVNMPGIGGLEATRVIKKRHPEVKIVGLSIQRGDAAEDEMIRAGASAYLTKGGRSELLFETLRRVAKSF